MMTKKMVDHAASGKTAFQYLIIVAAAASSINTQFSAILSFFLKKKTDYLPVAIVTAYKNKKKKKAY